ncbi:DNA repair protein RecO [Persephonella sp.]
MEGIFKDEAIVLRRSPAGEYDLSVTVYFRKRGKENIYIPKGQFLKSPYITSTEQFNWFKGVFLYRRENVFVREIDTFKNLSLYISSDLKRFDTAFLYAGLFNRYVIFPDEKLFIFLKKSFYYLTKAKKIENHRINFIAKLIYLSGIFPQLKYCTVCGETISKNNFKGVSVQNGGSVCRSCDDRTLNPFIKYEDIKIMDILSRVSFNKVDSITVRNPEKIEIFLQDYLKEKV